ncbi:hypothetical protein M5K25_015824 [Dendrobium thyrsiflorum]|uniref:Cation/H+ exchanger transmembrane domain-containing protein n=1 Tax=Dendrobium thyrsiflorum TaxID=117978 RepID=A0ABD0UYG4_DENTH
MHDDRGDDDKTMMKAMHETLDGGDVMRLAVEIEMETEREFDSLACMRGVSERLVVGGFANVSKTEMNLSCYVVACSLQEMVQLSRRVFLPLLTASDYIISKPSGFSLAPKPFFSNFGAIITFAILGTLIASVVTGLLVYLGGLIFIMYRLPLVECMMFGALISATDPVTVLSIFQELGTDMNLYALVFGESVLNDAMAISLYRTMSSVRSHASSGQHFFMLIVRFLETFIGSMSSGSVVLLKTTLAVSCFCSYMNA